MTECSETCKDKVCDQSVGNCTCVAGYYGSQCDKGEYETTYFNFVVILLHIVSLK